MAASSCLTHATRLSFKVSSGFLLVLQTADRIDRGKSGLFKVRPHRTRSAAADCGLCPLRNVTFKADSFNYYILKAQFLSN